MSSRCGAASSVDSGKVGLEKQAKMASFSPTRKFGGVPFKCARSWSRISLSPSPPYVFRCRLGELLQSLGHTMCVEHKGGFVCENTLARVGHFKDSPWLP